MFWVSWRPLEERKGQPLAWQFSAFHCEINSPDKLATGQTGSPRALAWPYNALHNRWAVLPMHRFPGPGRAQEQGKALCAELDFTATRSLKHRHYSHSKDPLHRASGSGPRWLTPTCPIHPILLHSPKVSLLNLIVKSLEMTTGRNHWPKPEQRALQLS